MWNATPLRWQKKATMKRMQGSPFLKGPFSSWPEANISGLQQLLQHHYGIQFRGTDAFSGLRARRLDLAAVLIRSEVSNGESMWTPQPSVNLSQSEASLQVSCLTEEIQKLMDSNQQLKSDISNEMKPVLLVCQRWWKRSKFWRGAE